MEGLLSRIFVILSNLESPETRGDHASNQGNIMSGNSLDNASFLLEGNSMFRWGRLCSLISGSSGVLLQSNSMPGSGAARACVRACC